MIYIVRHGETDYNIEGRYSGRIDSQLNSTGIAQAKEVREKLKDIQFDKVFSSPLSRAYQTATIIYNKDIIIDDRLIERSNGDLEGKLKTDIKEEINFNDPTEKRYNIESIVDFRKRIYNFLDEITNTYKNQNILIVTHAGVGIYVRCYFEGEVLDNNYRKYKINNCEVLIYKN